MLLALPPKRSNTELESLEEDWNLLDTRPLSNGLKIGILVETNATSSDQIMPAFFRDNSLTSSS